jgi:dihydroflavonol-4-reductase
MANSGGPDQRLAVVTGASGHVGANLVRGLLGHGRPVRALIHSQTRAMDGLPVQVVRADVLDRASLVPAFARADCVYHLAAKVSAGWSTAPVVREINVVGTRNVVEACVAAGVRRLVHFSSVQALVPGADAVDENCRLVEARDGQGAYDFAKAEAERLVLAAGARGLDAVIVNPTAVIGPYDFQPSPMGEVLFSLAHGRLPALVAGAQCDFVDVRDVVAAALAAAEQGRRGERYLLSGARLSLVELARLWARVTSQPAPRFAVPMGLARLAAPFAAAWARLRRRRPLFTPESLRVLRHQRPVDRRKAESELVYRPRPIEETLRDTYSWWQEQGGA